MKNMDERGITLIELLIVIAIIIILVVAASITIPGLVGKYNIENQVRAFHTDLLSARARARERNMRHFVVVTATNYQVFEDTNESGGTAPNAGDNTAPGFTNPKSFLPNYGVSAWADTIVMDTRGIVQPALTPLGTTIRFNIGTLEPEYDCVVISQTRINIGRWNGADCAQR
ncbi:MAG: prepilin-type N-terminal cleavage/methylation domain-containing protein [Nitrospirae bacterium]|nr:prepilin-type N-terminal cleavage/methylation domain-containing protein [Nitrospirota bacterium]